MSKYIFDIDAIMGWVLNCQNSPSKEIEINEGYDVDDEGHMSMISKIYRETKSINSQDDTIRYDFIKVLLSEFMGNINEMNPGNIYFETFKVKGFIKEHKR